MLKRFLPYSLLFVLPFMIACGGEQKDSTNNQENQEKAGTEQEEVCTYSYDGDQTSFTWTAYKFTERVGVSGTFDTINVVQSGSGASPLDILTGMSFRIPISSVNSNNPVRDKKIQESFFGKMQNTSMMAGKVREVMKESETEGTINMEIIMNDMPSVIPMQYTLSNDSLHITGTIDVSSWNAGEGLQELNAVCEDLHKGSDGKSLLWPDIKLEINTIAAKVCK